MTIGAERRRLDEDTRREKNWKRWGPYLSDRQWGTVREDYSPDGAAWEYFPHDHARSRAYRWGEDGLLGICDREERLCFGLALWNGRDPILKERLFGLTGPEGNHGEDDAILHVLPTLWFRNTWSWGREGEAYWPRPSLREIAPGRVRTDHATLEPHVLAAAPGPDGRAPDLLFTENETNAARLFAFPNASPYVKDAFHEYVVHGRTDAVSPERSGTKAAVHYRLRLPARGEVVLSLRLTREEEATDAPFGPEFDRTFARRIVEADEFYAQASAVELTAEERPVVRQAAARLPLSEQVYHYVVREWLEGDPAQPPPPAEPGQGRHHDSPHLFQRDVISM